MTKRPLRWTLAVEIFWHVEHLPLRYEGQVFAPLARWGYRMRKACERRRFFVATGESM